MAPARTWTFMSMTILFNSLSVGLSFTTSTIPKIQQPFRITPHNKDLTRIDKDLFGARTSSASALLTTPVFHMGHSHAHHHHHDQKEDHDTVETLTPAQRTQRRLRRMAMSLFCALAILGPKAMATPRLPIHRADWMTLVISIVGLCSADTLRRNMVLYWQKLKGFGHAIAKHSSSSPSMESSTSSGGINKMFSKTTTTSSKSNVLYALKNTNSNNIRDTSEADRVTWVGVFINIVLSVGKFVIGVQQNSSVLIADAGHSFSDLISDFITLWSVRVARLPPDEDHPYGHYKFEALGSLFLSLTLIGTGLSVGAMSHKQLLPFLAPGGMAAAQASAELIPVPGAIALVMAAISIASKEWLYRITKRVGEKLNSPVVVANAFHHRSDALSSVLALLSIAWAMAGFAAADAAAGLLVAGMIAMTGCDILAESIQQLSDSANLDLQDDLREVVEEWVDIDPDVLQITTLRARQVGSASFCDVTVETWPDLTTTATRAVEERLKRYLVPALQERTGRWITATIHAKAPLEVREDDHDDKHDDEHVHSSLETRSSAMTGDNPNSSNAKEDPHHEDLTASQVEMRVRHCALRLQPVGSAAYRLQSVQVHYLSSDSVSVDITLDQSKMDLEELKESARTLQQALESDLEEIQSARIYLDLIGREREHGMSDEDDASTSLSGITTSSSPVTTNLPVQYDTQYNSNLDEADLSLLEVDPLWPSSFASDMQRIWNESNILSTNSTATTTTSLGT